MISQTNSSMVRATYTSALTERKEIKENVTLSKSEDTNKLKELKESIDSGSYKVNIDALSKKIADTLL